ncbi:ABC transporter substrate-binding protein [Acrocarpospora pleiomorpha]|uniref:ABC transporter substrate-binding protein n=1 Tax=Acrocarpospora pleiomorpha TaxID=90975 RepID=UPI0014781DAE|nr:ABC transporter substrate-binding protein [Acrocarpospora pleiomorpha]
MITSLTDFSGPFAARGPAVEATRQVVIDWFNEDQGKKLGVKLEQKTYDDGYDQAKAAQLAPKVLGEEKGIGILFSGAPTLQGLGQRLLSSGIPAVNAGPPYSFNKGEGNVFSPVGDIGSAWSTGIREKLGTWKGSGPMRVALVSFDGASGQDFVKSAVETLAGTNAEVVLKEFIPVTANDVGVNIERVVGSEPDLVVLGTTDVLQPLLLDGLKQRKFDMTKVMLSQHEGLSYMTQLGVSPDVLEGVWEVTTLNYANEQSEAYQIFKKAMDSGKYKDLEWSTPNLLNFSGTMTLVKAIGRAAEKHNGKIGNAEVLAELNAGTFDGMGLQGEIRFDPADRRIGATTAFLYRYEGGKVVPVTNDIPLVKLP